MRFLRSSLAGLVVACAVPWSAARADRVDAFVPLGKTVKVSVAAPGDVASAAFLVQSGTGKKLSITVKAAGRPSPSLDVRLIAPDGSVVDPSASGGRMRVTKSLATISLPTVPQAGLWRVEVRGASGTAGGASVKIRATDKSSVPATKKVVPASGTASIPIDAGAGQAVTVSIKRDKGSTIVPQLRILDPNGQPLAEGAFLGKASPKTGAFALKSYRLPSFGRYELVVSGQEGRGGGIVLTAKTAPARPVRGAPTANAGKPSDAEPSTTKALDGSGSAFAGGTGTFQWVQVAGPPVTLVGASTAGPSFVAPDVPSSLGFELVVGEEGRWSPSTPVTVEVGLRPLADAGRSQAVAAGAAGTLDGSGSLSRRATQVTFAWTQDPEDVAQVTLTGAASISPTFTAPAAPTLLHFSLVVDDGTLRSAADTVTVRVGDLGQATPDAGRPQSVSRMATVYLSALATRTASGPLDVPLLWTQVSGPAVTLADPASPWPSFTAPKVSADLGFEISAGGATDRVTVFVRANEWELAPLTRGNGTQTAASGVVTLSAAWSIDTDNGPALGWRWAQVDGEALAISDPNAVAPTVTLPAGNASRVYAVQATDGIAYGQPDLVAVRNTGYSGKPVANAGADVAKGPLQAITLNGLGSGRTQGTGPITYRWRQVSARDWFDVAARVPSFDATAAAPTFSIPATLSSLTERRTILFELIVNDGVADSAPDLVTVTVFDLPPNLLPKITAGMSDTNPTALTPATLVGTAFDDDGDPLTFKWTQVSGPSQIQLSSSTALSPTFTTPKFGTFTFRLVANDGTADSLPATVGFLIDEAPTASALVNPSSILPHADATVDASASSDPEGKALTYEWSQVIPEAPIVTGFPTDTSTSKWTASVADDPILLALVVNDGRQDSAILNVSLNVGAPIFPTASVSVQKMPYGGKAKLTGDATGVGPFTYAWSQVTTGSNALDPPCTIATPASATTDFTMGRTSTRAFGTSPSATFRLTVTNPYKSVQQDVKVFAYASFGNPTNFPGGSPGVQTVIGISANSCSNCHSGQKNQCPVNPTGGTSASNYSLLTSYFRPYSINITSCASSKHRIAPGNSAQSYMIDVMTGAGTHPTTYTTESLWHIKDWIDQGALDN